MDAPCSKAGKRLLVTGGAGFIGSHLVRRLTDMGADVTVLTRAGSPLWRLPQTGCRRIAPCDVTDAAEVQRALAQASPDGVFHLAAYGADAAQRDISRAVGVNVNGTVNVLTAMAACGCRRIVMMGSGAEYGNRPAPIAEDALPLPENAYASTKAAATLIARQYAAQHGIGLVVLRPFGVYGEAEPRHKIFCHAILSMLRGEPLDLTPCTQCRDYCYVGDVVDAAVAAYEKEALQSAVINLGTGCARPLRDYIERIRALIRPSGAVNYGALPHREGEQWQPAPDVRLASGLLNWRCAHSLEDGLARTVAWFRENSRYYD